MGVDTVEAGLFYDYMDNVEQSKTNFTDFERAMGGNQPVGRKTYWE